MARGSKAPNRPSASSPANNPDPDQTLEPVLEEVIGPTDARVTIEMNQFKYTDVPIAAMHMQNLTRDDVAEAIRQYQTRPRDPPPQAVAGPQQAENSENSANSHRSRRSVFDRIGDKGQRIAQKAQSKNHEAEKLKQLAELKEKIREEEQAKLDLRIQKRFQEEEEKLWNPRSKRPHREISPELISDEEGPEENLIQMIQELQKKVNSDSGFEIQDTLTPFSHSLESIPRQKNLKHYNFDSFDGLVDPEEHLNYFEQIAQIYYYNDLTKCRFFASTLKGGAQRWFSRIPSRSIQSWKDFREAFLKRFQANRTQDFHMCHLETIRQYDNESLSGYMKRFQEAINKVTNLDEREALSIFRRNLDPDQNERYVVELINKEPRSLAAAYALAAKFIRETDVLKAMRMTRTSSTRTKEDRSRDNYQIEKKFKPNKQSNYIPASQLTVPGKSDPTKPRTDTRPPRSESTGQKPEPEWTPLNRPRAEILKEVRGKPFYYPPKPMVAPPEDRPQHKHCDYHATHGHYTENCLALKYFIEEQAKKGNMGQYLARRDDKRVEGFENQKPKNVVHVVLGGSASPPRRSHDDRLRPRANNILQ